MQIYYSVSPIFLVKEVKNSRSKSVRPPQKKRPDKRSGLVAWL